MEKQNQNRPGQQQTGGNQQNRKQSDRQQDSKTKQQGTTSGRHPAQSKQAGFSPDTEEPQAKRGSGRNESLEGYDEDDDMFSDKADNKQSQAKSRNK